MFDDIMGSALGTATNSRTFVPEVDVRTTEDDVRIVCDVPGIRQEDLDITLANHVLTIKGGRKFDAKENEQVVLGRRYGAFNRQFTLPDSLDASKLSATLVDGVLSIHIPKHPKAKPIKIQISEPHTKQLDE